MPVKIYRIYKITNTCNQKVYIGFTGTSILRRWKQHVSAAQKNARNSKLYAAINKYGEEMFLVKEIFSSKNKKHTLKIKEPYFISFFDSQKSGYNIRPGGEGAPGSPSKEHRQKLSDANKGKKRSKESIKKQSQVMRDLIEQRGGSWKKGIAISEVQKQKQSLALTGRKHSKIHRQHKMKPHKLISPTGELIEILGTRKFFEYCKHNKIQGRKLFDTHFADGWVLLF